MRALVWIEEATWAACVDGARRLLPADAEVTILHVAASDVEQLAEHPAPGRLGRRHRAAPGPPVRRTADAEAQALLDRARQRFGRPARTLARRGRVEREVLEAGAGADVLVMVRGGEPCLGPRSLGHRTRFVLDHAGCAVLLAWPQQPPGPESVHWPPHLR